MLATLSQVNYSSSLTNRVRDLPHPPQFVELLDQITREFEHFLRAIDMINNESLEIMLEQILEAFTLKIGQIFRSRTHHHFHGGPGKTGAVVPKLPRGMGSGL